MPLQSFCIIKNNMPKNLNALIRYKRIDSCLKNPYVPCTIKRLQEACTEAMGEFRGIYKLVSERTIRDDIRVLKSNILGFNAPIEFKDGKYIYTDSEYSIFDTPISELQLLNNIFKILLKERKNFEDIEVDKLIQKISTVIGKKIPSRILRSIREYERQKYEAERKPDSDITSRRACLSIEPSTDYVIHKITKEVEHIETFMLWGRIMSILT